MDPTNEQRSWSRYLAAESAGRSEEAEALLAALFQCLPRPVPRAGFADRVLARVRRRTLFSLPAVRFGLAAGLVAAALGLVLILPMVPGLLGLIEPGTLLAVLIRSFGSVLHRLAAGVAFWEPAIVAGQALGRVILQPTILILLVAQFGVAAAALRTLARLASPQRSLHHAAL